MGVLEKNVARWQSGKPIFETSFATGKVANWQSCKVAMGVLPKVCQNMAKWQCYYSGICRPMATHDYYSCRQASTNNNLPSDKFSRQKFSIIRLKEASDKKIYGRRVEINADSYCQ